jgi:hypothetical protein
MPATTSANLLGSTGALGLLVVDGFCAAVEGVSCGGGVPRSALNAQEHNPIIEETQRTPMNNLRGLSAFSVSFVRVRIRISSM